jgi:Methyltransferase domain
MKLLEWYRNPERFPELPGIMTGLEELAQWLREQLGIGAVMYEIGSYAGESAAVFSKYFHTVHCIDPWTKGYADPGDPSPEEIEASFDERARIAGNIFKHKGMSPDALVQIPDESVDFIYIDAGMHNYKESLRDIMVSWPKVRREGFLGGHDYCKKFPGVMASIKYFFKEPEKYALRVFPDTSYVVRKPIG